MNAGKRRRDAEMQVAIVNLSMNQQQVMEEWMSMPVAARLFQATFKEKNVTLQCTSR